MLKTMKCIYETPCNWCSKWDKKCDCKIGCENSSASTTHQYYKNIEQIKNGHLPPLNTDPDFGLQKY